MPVIKLEGHERSVFVTDVQLSKFQKELIHWCNGGDLEIMYPHNAGFSVMRTGFTDKWHIKNEIRIPTAKPKHGEIWVSHGEHYYICKGGRGLSLSDGELISPSGIRLSEAAFMFAFHHLDDYTDTLK